MLSFSQRLSTTLLTFAIAAGQASVCAGWMPSPEARMACCSGHDPCPMHKSESRDDASPRVLSQAEADRCCAASEQDDSTPTPSNFAFSAPAAVAISPVPVVIPEPEAHVTVTRASVPIPATHVPKHLLLSVFLV